MDYGAESNDRTERKSCGDPYELAAQERWVREHEFDPEGDNGPPITTKEV